MSKEEALEAFNKLMDTPIWMAEDALLVVHLYKETIRKALRLLAAVEAVCKWEGTGRQDLCDCEICQERWQDGVSSREKLQNQIDELLQENDDE